MTRSILKTGSLGAAMALFATFSGAQGVIQLDIPLQETPGIAVRHNLPVVTGAIGINCPAPAVRSMTARRIGGDLVRIEAEIANIGGVNYVSGEGQQLVTLTDGHGSPIGYRSFVTLAAGESFVFGTERRWNPTSEFQDSFGAVITYAPDISIDGNTANDDCRLYDNSRTISPEEINALFD